MTSKRKFILDTKSGIALLATGISIFIIVVGIFYYRYQVSKVKDEKDNEFLAISDLKINQLVQWQKERSGDAFVFSHLPFFITLVDQWIINRNNDQLIQRIKERMSLFQLHYYKNISLS